MTPNEVAILLREQKKSKWLGAATCKRTTVRIECPHIIESFFASPTTEDKEFGTDHG
jgi:hypothetical protein